MTKVLVVDDEFEVRDYLVTILSNESFDVIGIDSGSQVFETIDSFQPDILLLDYRMPGMSGVEVVQRLRNTDKYRGIPIIMVTGLDGEEEKVRALEVGADDYVVKPFLPKELSARIKAILRRANDNMGGDIERLENDGLVVDLRSHKVTLDGNEIYLTLTEFKILGELLKRKGQVLSRDRLRQTALGNLNVTDRTIDVHMASLRKKLERCADCIQTVRGVGYRFAN